MPTPTERDPLLSRRRTDDEEEDVETTSKTLHSQKKKVGPLDIDRRTRWGILAGIWTATFLSVSLGYRVCELSTDAGRSLLTVGATHTLCRRLG